MSFNEMSIAPSGRLSWASGMRLFRMGSFGFSSGLSAFFLFSTMNLWAADCQVPLWLIGMMSLTAIPYSMKIVLSPFVEMVRFGPLSSLWGVYKSWIFVTQSSLIAILWILSFLNPAHHVWSVSLCCFLFALMSTMQDCVLETYRIQSTPRVNQTSSASANSFGFRLGLGVASALPLLVAHYINWPTALRVFSLCVALGMIIILTAPYYESESGKFCRKTYKALLWQSYDFFKTTYRFPSIIGMIFSYKLGEIFLRSMMSLFLFSCGYSMRSIASLDKGMGMLCVLMGVCFSAFILRQCGMALTWRWWSVWQTIVALVWCVLSFFSLHDSWFLVLHVGMSHAVGGWGNTTQVAYFSNLCAVGREGIAVRYATLTSLASLSRVIVTSSAGFIAHFTSWPVFFFLAALCCLPAFWLSFSATPFSPVSSPQNTDTPLDLRPSL